MANTTKTPTVAQLQAGYDKINARNGKDDYFARMQTAYSADPEAYNAKVDKAIFDGQVKAELFLANIRDSNSPTQAIAINRFVNVYGSDPTVVVNDFVAKELLANNIQTYESRNPVYESSLLQNVVIATPAEQKAVSDCRSFFNDKWSSSGYLNDDVAMKTFQSELKTPFRGTVNKRIRGAK